MKHALLLPWFPILLGVGLGGRLLGQSRGFGLGALSALFWIVLVQAGSGTSIWRDPWQVGALVCGAVVLVLMGGWAGQSEVRVNVKPIAGARENERAADRGERDSVTWAKVSATMEQFDDWMTRHQNHREPWAKFGEFVRSVLYDCCQATHVKCYRYLESTQELECVDEDDDGAVGVSEGTTVGCVFATGRSFLGEEAQAPDSSPSSNEPSVCWCFPIEKESRRVGVVAVGQLGIDQPSRALMLLMERLIALFWLHVTEVSLNRVAEDEDPVSGLLNRQTFLRTADAALRESYEQGEPVALAVVGIQGLRQLNDAGRWEVADELVREVGLTLQAKARMDDRIGRFDGSRFIWLLRRVDAELAGLILKHVIHRLEQLCSDRRWGVPAAVYCGLTGSGRGRPDLRRLVTVGLQESHRARTDHVLLATDLEINRDSQTVISETAGVV